MGVSVAVDLVHPQGEHGFGMLDAPPGAGPLQAIRPRRLQRPARSRRSAYEAQDALAKRHQRIITQLPDRHPPPSAKSIQPELTLHRFEIAPGTKRPIASSPDPA